MGRRRAARLAVGDRVEVLRPWGEEEEWIKAEVVELLSSQFVYRTDEGQINIQLYSGGWRHGSSK